MLPENKKRMARREQTRRGSTLMVGIAILAVLGFVLVYALSPFLPYQPASASQSEIHRFASEQELTSFLNEKQQRYESYGYGSYMMRATAGAPTMAQAGAAESADSGAKAADYSTTNVQVAGVDEPDVMKNDGRYIYTITGNKVVIVDAYPATNAAIVATIDDDYPQDLFVNGNRLVVFGYETVEQPEPLPGISEPTMPVAERMAAPDYYPYPYYSQKAFIRIYDISDRSAPQLVRNLSYDGSYLNSRMIDDYVYAIISAPVQYAEGGVVLPQLVKDDQVFPDVYYVDMPLYSYSFTNIVSVNVNDDTEEPRNKVFLLDSSNALYVSADNIYLTHGKVPDSVYILEQRVSVLQDVVPGDVNGRISSALASDGTYGEKEQTIEQIFGEWFRTLTPEEQATIMQGIQEKLVTVEENINREYEKTVIHKISVNNGAIEYVKAGEVVGSPLNQFSMDEYNGYFRIATTTHGFWGGMLSIAIAPGASVGTAVQGGQGVVGQATQAVDIQEEATPSTDPEQTANDSEEQDVPETVVAQRELIVPIAPPVREGPRSANNVYVLDGDMNLVGSLENLAPGETIYSARFIADRAYLVTFVKIDPLFVIDLSDPRAPTVLGKLKIPGYSDYLHPYDETHIIGVGKEAIGSEQGNFAWYQGLKLSLFDVSDVENPIEVAKLNIGDRGSDSYALHDHKAFLFDREKELLVIPVLLAEIDESDYPSGLPDWAYGEFVWQGAYVISLTPEDGFEVRGRISHDSDDIEKSGYYYYSSFSVKRSLYMDDTLYTVSDAQIKANSLSDLSEIKTVGLPYEQQGWYGEGRI